MIPLLLQAHTRSLTKIIFNNEGDLLFSASKDDKPNVWRSLNGERMGSYNGHKGTVWTLDVTRDTLTLATGSADNSVRLWDVRTGRTRTTIETESGVRSLSWSAGDQVLAVVTDATMGFQSTVLLHDVRVGQVVAKFVPTATPDGSIAKKATTIKWTDCNEALLTGHDDGRLALWDARLLSARSHDQKGAVQVSPAVLFSEKHHQDTIRDIQFSSDRTYFITASKDTTAKLVETANLRVIKTFQTERPVNSASISPLRPEVLVAGGQEALSVTTTSSRAGQFEARVFHAIWENELGRISGHFGPINTLSYNPTGRGYASGAEDGYIRLHTFDPDYYEFAYTEDVLEEPLL